MPKRKKSREKPGKPLDMGLVKRGRGRPRKAIASEIGGRAENFRGILGGVWDRLWPLLSKAKNEEEAIRAFEEGAAPYQQQFIPHLAPLALRVLRESDFPKRNQTRINFLADSLAALGAVSPRRSREICEDERANKRKKSPHHIIRKEYYVECSCGYKGPARDDACRKCGAEIGFSFEELI